MTSAGWFGLRLPRTIPISEPAAMGRTIVGPATAGNRLARWCLGTMLLGLPVAAIVAASGWLAPAVSVLLVICAAEVVSSRSQVADAVTLFGVDARWRALIGTLIGVLALARGGVEAGALIGFSVVALMVQATWTSRLGLVMLAHRKQPPLAYRPKAGRDQPPSTRRFADFYGRADSTPLDLSVHQAGALLAAALTTVPGWSAAVWLLPLAALTAAGLMAADGLEYVRLGRFAASAEAALVADLERGGATAVCYLSGGAGQARYLLNQWLHAFEALPGGLVVIVREASHLGEIDATPLTVLYAPHTRNVERLVTASVRVAFYSANGGRNIDLQRDPRLAHVFLGHGDSDKSTSATPIARVYDEVWVAGPVAIERYRSTGVDLADGRFAVVGRPQVDGLFVGYLDHARPVLLYAPTFEGYYEHSNYSSLERMGVDLVGQLLRQGKVDVWFKPHPSTGIQLPGMIVARDRIAAAIRAAGGRHMLVDDIPGKSLYDCFDTADVLLSDVSSVISDFLHTERPILVTNPQGLDHHDFLTRFPSQAGSAIVDRADENFLAAVDEALGPDRYRARRVAMKLQVLGDLPHGPIAAFVANTERLAGGRQDPPGGTLS